MYLLIKHLLSTAWVPARPEGPEHSDCGVQYTEAGQTGSGPGIGRWRPQAGSILAWLPLSLPGPRTGLARGQWEAVGTGASSPSLGKLQGRRLPEGPPQGGSPGAHLPLTPLLVTPGRTLGPLEGLPSLTHEVRSISLSRWSAGEMALLGGRAAKCRTRGERHSPFLAARHRAGGSAPCGALGAGEAASSALADGLAQARSALSPSSRNVTWGECPQAPHASLASDTFLGVPGGLCTTLDRRVVPLPRARCSLKAGTEWVLGSAGGACGFHEGTWLTRHVGLASCEHVQASCTAVITPPSLLDSLPAWLSSGDRPGQLPTFDFPAALSLLRRGFSRGRCACV